MNGGGTLRSLRPLLFSPLGVLGTLLLSGRLVGYEWDQALLLPIIRAGAEPGLYPPEDLIVTAGLQGPFHFYHLASFLYRATSHFAPWWFALYVLLLAATYAGYWRLARVVGGSDRVAAATVLTISLMDAYLGTLHWAGVPSAGPVSGHAAMPFVVFGFSWLLEGRYGPALAMVPAAFIFHPAIGLILAGCLLFSLLLERGLPARRRAGLAALVLAGLLPNALFLSARLGANWAPPAPSPGGVGFQEIFENFSYHAYIGFHWREGYGWFFLLLAAAAWGLPAVAAETRRRILWVTLACLLAAGGYFLNLYAVRYPGLMLTFLARVSMFLKPIGLAVVIAGLFDAGRAAGRDPRRWALLAIGLALLLSALRPPVPAAEARFCLGLGVLLLAARDRRVVGLGALLGVAGLAQLLLIRARTPAAVPLAGTTTGINVALGAAVAVALLLLRRRDEPSAEPGPRPSDDWRAVAAIAMAALVLGAWPMRKHRERAAATARLGKAVHLAYAPASTKEIFGWFRERSRQGSLVLIPPADNRFDWFRFETGRGVYAAVPDINQLSYDLRFYVEGYRRLERSGLVVRGPHDFDTSGYHRLTVGRLLEMEADAGLDYAVFETARQTAELAAVPSVFEGNGFRVIDVRRLAGKS